MKQTPLYKLHLQHHAKMVDFAGWNMPLHYGSQIDEHNAVRTDAGMFDVSHMGIIDIAGDHAFVFLRRLLTNDIAKLKNPGTALYSCMLNEQGGIIDDLIVYWMKPEVYRLVVNASTSAKDLAWIQTQATPYPVKITLRQDLSILSVQGPNAVQKVIQAFPKLGKIIINLKPFHCVSMNIDELVNPERENSELNSSLPVEEDGFIERWMLIARTGYTGEEGIELILPNTDVDYFWNTFANLNIRPIGLGARDTLRLEAGLNLYGQDMDDTVTPLESNLSWTVVLEPSNRDFIGREALVSQKEQGIKQQLLGLILQDKGVLRHDQPVFSGEQFLGKITSGSFSPTLNQSIALARLQVSDVQALDFCDVEIRHRRLSAKIVKPPFVRRKKL